MDNHQDNYEMAEYALRQSWETHRQAFGPILEPAFVENQQVRIPLIAALNHISRREVKEGMEILKQIKEFCIYDEDKAAWIFFVGLCYELGGAKKQALQWYADGARYHHKFYLPYLKLAKAAVDEKQYEAARAYYETGIACLLEMSENEQDPVILGSAYTNLASSLTMLHRYPEAEKAWETAMQYPTQPRASAVAAVLYAATGDRETANAYMKKLEKADPAFAQQIWQAIQKIFDGTHPDFPAQ